MANRDESGSADKLLSLIRAVVQDEIKKTDDTVLCRVVKKNDDSTYDVYVEPDENNVIHNIPVLTNLRDLKPGDYVYVYKIKNQMNNSFIFKTPYSGLGDGGINTVTQVITEASDYYASKSELTQTANSITSMVSTTYLSKTDAASSYTKKSDFDILSGSVETLDGRVEGLIDYTDGITNTFYKITEPTIADDDLKDNDVWYCIASSGAHSGKVYKCIDADAATFNARWTEITDEAFKKALDAASDAQSTADQKIKTYAQNDAPTEGMEIGDIWIETDADNKLYRYSGSAWVAYQDSHLDGTVSALQSSVGTLIDKVDGKTATFYMATPPTVANDKLEINDIWYCTSTNTSYTYYQKILKCTAVTPSVTWQDVTSNTLASALTAAGTAQATADKKIMTYAQNNQPSGGTYDIGDLWIDTDDNNKLYRYNGSSWEAYRDTHLDNAVSALQSAVGTLIDDVDGLTTTFYLANAPTVADDDLAVGDVWYCLATSGVNAGKVFKCTAITPIVTWQDITSETLKVALDAAGDAQATANSKIKTYAQNDAPSSGMEVGDLWIDTNDNNKIYRYNGSAWVPYQDSHLDGAVSALQSSVGTLTDRVDGKTTTFYMDTPPTVANDHLEVNDIWYCTSTTTSYTYYQKILKCTAVSPSVTWDDVTSNTLAKALTAAGTAQATADKKIRTYAQNDEPSGGTYDIGDLWIDTNDNNKIYRYAGSGSGQGWKAYQDSHLDATVSTHTSEITQLSTDISAKVSSTGGVSSSFGWSLTADGFFLDSDSNRVMSVTKDGLLLEGNATFSGDVVASTLTSSNGFDLSDGTIANSDIAANNFSIKGINFTVPSQGRTFYFTRSISTSISGSRMTATFTVNSYSDSSHTAIANVPQDVDLKFAYKVFGTTERTYTQYCNITISNGHHTNSKTLTYNIINPDAPGADVMEIGGVSPSSAELYGSGSTLIIGGNLTVSGIVTATSDARKKENITDFYFSKSILDLPIKQFSFKTDEEHKKYIGCMAQDLQKICPEIVHEDEDGYLSIEENKIVYLLLDAVKKLKKKIDFLEGK